MPCDLKSSVFDGMFRVCGDDHLRDMVSLMSVLNRRSRRREAKLVYNRIGVLLACRGVAGKNPYFELQDGSFCRLAGDGKNLFITPSGLSGVTYRNYVLSQRELNVIDSRRFPRATLREPEQYCSREIFGEPLFVDTRFFGKDDHGAVSHEAIELAVKGVA